MSRLRWISGALARKTAGIREMLEFDNGYALILDRLWHPRRRLAVYRRGELEIVVDRTGGDLGSIRTCLATPMYRSLFAELRLPKIISVLDIGANVGGFSLMLASLGYQFRTLVAVELNPNTALRLRLNLLGNLRSAANGIRVHVAGLWERQGVTRQKFGWGSTGDTLDVADTTRLQNGVEIPLRTLDDIIGTDFGDSKIDICKIDVEGAEHDVFRGNSFSRLTQVRYLVMEIHGRDQASDAAVVEAVCRLGFTVAVPAEENQDSVYVFANVRSDIE